MVNLLRKLNSVSLKVKLMGLVSLLAVMIGLSGGSGLYFISSTGENIRILSDVAVPLTREADSLASAMNNYYQNLTAVIQDDDLAANKELRQKLDVVQNDAITQEQYLARLGKEADLSLNVNEVSASREAFFSVALVVLNQHEKRVVASNMAAQQFNQFENQRKQLETLLVDFTRDTEELMSQTEDKTKTFVQSGRAKVSDLDRELNTLFNKTYPLVSNAYKMMRSLAQLQDTTRQYLTETDTNELARLAKRQKQYIKRALQSVKRISSRAESDTLKAYVTSLDQNFNNINSLLTGEQGLHSLRQQELAASVQANASIREMLGIGEQNKELLSQVSVLTKDLSDESNTQVQSAVSSAIYSVSIIVIFGITVGLILGWIVARSIAVPVLRAISFAENMASGDFTARLDADTDDEIGSFSKALNRMADAVSGMVKQINQSAEHVAATTMQQSQVMKDLEKTSDDLKYRVVSTAAALEELSASSEEVSRGMDETVSKMDHAADRTQSGKEKVGASVATIEKIRAGSIELEAAIKNLNSSSKAIDAIVIVINGIAEQTNLLALNAAIEAARAGEQGRGFAVVADEVRTLAARTQKATNEVSDIIKKLQEDAHRADEGMQNSVTAVDEGISIAGEMDKVFDEIVHAVDDVTTLSKQAAMAVEQQARTTVEINENIQVVSTASEKTATATGEVAQGLDRLNEEMEKMMALNKRFKV